MTASALETVGILAASGAAAAALVLEGERARRLAIAGALVAAPVLVAGDVWHEERFVNLRGQPAELAVLLVAAAVALVAGAAFLWRFPRAFPVLAFAVMPLRVPLDLGGQTSNLLVPLYAVIAAQAAASLYGAFVAGRPASAPARAEPRLGTWLRRLLAASVLLYGLQSLYSDDVSNAIENLGFFLVPFAALFAQFLGVAWGRRLVRDVVVVVSAVAAICALVAFAEYASRDLVLNSELELSNQIHLYFRVNSLFHDPNVFGRYLALVITMLAVVVAWTPERRTAVAAAGLALALLIALAFSFSLTSFAALLAGLLVAALLRYGWRWAAAAAAVMLVAGAAFVALGGTERSDVGPERGVNTELSGREGLVSGGLRLARDRPVWGWGSGSFGRAFTDEIRRAETTTSHAEPITVAAEQGVIGLAVYGALLAVSLMLLFSAGTRGSPARAAVAACYVAMIVHSIGYAGFDIDPATWALLAAGLSFAALDPTPPRRAAA